jgi:hypothetical protein
MRRNALLASFVFVALVGFGFARMLETRSFKDYLITADMDRAYMGAEETQKYLIRYDKELAADLKELDVYGSKKN